jgi:hypothetical protein
MNKSISGIVKEEMRQWEREERGTWHQCSIVYRYHPQR